MPNTSLPIIDICGYHTASDAQLHEFADAIGAACQDNGFFYLTGHGISEDLQDKLFEQAKWLFALPEDEKRALDKTHSPANRGYEPMKNQTLESGAPPDLKEGFYIGHEHGDDHPMVKAGQFNFGQNQWPKNAETLQHIALQYLDETAELCEFLMSLLALSLDLPSHYFSDFCKDPLVTLRFLHYPQQPANPLPNEKGCGAHTDFGGLTLLLQDDKGGLQVWGHDTQQWLDATPMPGSYVVNLGDMISRWTNDQYRSTLHRVINTSGAERYAIPLFFSGHPTHEVSCIPTCLAANQSPAYPTTTVEAHMREMYQKTYGK